MAPLTAKARATPTVPIASNLILDREGRIRFFSLLDTHSFDARLVDLRAELDRLLGEESQGP